MAATSQAASSVTFGSAPATTVVVDSFTQITATAPSGSAGTATVTVTNPYGTSLTSDVGQYTYIHPPTVSSFTPTTGPTTGGTHVTITGTNLTGATAVKFGSTTAASFTVTSATTITAVTRTHTPRTVTLSVTTAAGTATSSSYFTFVVYPTIISVSPSDGPAAGDTTVRIDGTTLTGVSGIVFGGVAVDLATWTATGDAALYGPVPAHADGTVDVVVYSTHGTATKATAFTYLAAPTITSFTPTTGPTTGGTHVTITGTNLTGATAVKFGSTQPPASRSQVPPPSRP